MAQPGDEVVWLWLGAGGLLAGAVAVAAVGLRREATAARPFHWLVATAAGAAGLSYLTMALGLGTTVVTAGGVDVTVYVTRYVGWMIAGAALLGALWLLAGGRRGTLALLVGLAALAVALVGGAGMTTRSLAGLTLERTRLTLWSAAGGLLLVVLGVLIRVLSPQAGRQPREVAVRFSILRNAVVLLALLYPIVWVIGPLGLGLVGPVGSTVAFLVLDLLAVLGIGGFLLWDPETLVSARTGGESPSG